MNKKTVIDKIWDFFASVKLAVIIFALLSLTSIIGTIIEQNVDPAKNIRVISKLFGQSAAPGLFKVFDSLGFMDMYHSWWFVTILLLFAANLIICSVDRLPKIVKAAREPIKPLPEDLFKGFGIKKEILLTGRPEATRAAVSNAVKRVMGFTLAEVKEDNGYQLYAQRGSYTRLGVYITHFSILVILIGAILGIFLGFKGFLNLPEGSVSEIAYKRDGKEQPLGFGIRCDAFTVDFYGNTDMPKAYKSVLSIIKDGKEVMKKEISVNDPLKYEGVTFYQSSYGIVPGGEQKSIYRLRLTPKGGKTEDVELKMGESFAIAGTNLTGKIEDFSPALGFDQSTGKPFTYAEQMNNPAVLITFYENGQRKFGGWIFKRIPDTSRLPDGNIVEFAGVWGMQYTGLQVRRDPGVWVVYLGCITMAIGLFVTFFMSHRRAWIRLIEDKNRTRVVIGASANKNKAAFEARIDKLVSFLSKAPEGGR
ncbi:MAG: cytochrome c biogenesis protein ResB [Thermodesulfovibrionales bacterium]